MAKEMKKITYGTKKTEGLTWFNELSDKRKLIYSHICAIHTCR